MKTIPKYLLLSGLGALAVAGLAHLLKSSHVRSPGGIIENAGKSIDEGLKDSLSAIDKSVKHVQSVFEHIKTGRA